MSGLRYNMYCPSAVRVAQCCTAARAVVVVTSGTVVANVRTLGGFESISKRPVVLAVGSDSSCS